MMAFPFLITAMVWACLSVAKAYPVDGARLLPQEEKVHVRTLANGITAWVQENPFPPRSAAIRVVVQSTPYEEALFSLDTSSDNFAEIEQFLFTCREKFHSNLGEETTPQGEHLVTGISSVQERALLSSCSGESCAVVAVGDFSESAMYALIESHFGGLTFPPRGGKAPIQVDLSSLLSRVALHIDYPLVRSEMDLYEDLKKNWLHVFAHDLLQQRLERLTRALGENWVHPYPRFLFPVHGFALVSEELSPDLFTFLLWEIHQIQHKGFDRSEFQTLQECTAHHLRYLAHNLSPLHSSRLASFYADEFRLSKRGIPYEAFIHASEEIIPTLTLEEVTPYVHQLLTEGNRSIHFEYPEAHHYPLPTVTEIEEMVEIISELPPLEESVHREGVLLVGSSLFPIQRSELPSMADQPSFLMKTVSSEGERESLSSEPTQGEIDLFLTLPLSHSEKDTIAYIISHMSDKNIFELAFEKKKMEEKGKKIHHVHPLRFIGHIFATYDLKKNMKRIKKSSFKWDAFIDGFAKRMKEENAKDNLVKYIPGFAKHVNANPERVAHFIHKKDWEGLVRYLM